MNFLRLNSDLFILRSPQGLLLTLTRPAVKLRLTICFIMWIAFLKCLNQKEMCYQQMSVRMIANVK